MAQQPIKINYSVEQYLNGLVGGNQSTGPFNTDQGPGPGQPPPGQQPGGWVPGVDFTYSMGLSEQGNPTQNLQPFLNQSPGYVDPRTLQIQPVAPSLPAIAPGAPGNQTNTAKYRNMDPYPLYPGNYGTVADTGTPPFATGNATNQGGMAVPGGAAGNPPGPFTNYKGGYINLPTGTDGSGYAGTVGAKGGSGGSGVQVNKWDKWMKASAAEGIDWDVLMDVYVNPNRKGTWGKFGSPDTDVAMAMKEAKEDGMWSQTFMMFQGRPPNEQEWNEHWYAKTYGYDKYRDPILNDGHNDAVAYFNQQIDYMQQQSQDQQNADYVNEPPPGANW